MDPSGRRSFVKVNISNLKMEPIGKGKLLLFNLLSFRFFWNSPNGKAMPLLPGNPAWLAPVIAIPYMLAALSAVHNFGGERYFIRKGDEVAGTVIMKARQDALVVQSLAVSPVKRRRGVGFFALAQAERLAKRMKLPWLELDVLKRNVSAQRLYWKFGFKTCAERRLSLMLRKRV